jgi:hypothetical protein
MAANTCTSKTGVVTGSDPNFVVTYQSKSSEGLVLYLKYTKGTESGITLTFDSINTSLSTADKYRHVSLSGTTLSAYTMFISATGNYRIPLPIIPSEEKIAANIVYGSAGQDGVLVVNFMEG